MTASLGFALKGPGGVAESLGSQVDMRVLCGCVPGFSPFGLWHSQIWPGVVRPPARLPFSGLFLVKGCSAGLTGWGGRERSLEVKSGLAFRMFLDCSTVSSPNFLKIVWEILRQII